ncbi:hypothetical protein [Gordonia sp. C13]|uniref:hypothetical protein n=1 Tax=Gordonia sp. C13 TaxID=2935078 RepID=UPI00200AA5DA|nr:hypothetical protein [Gordonia sp. C13]MCK8612736.1 hypothetical protein [Gordonia sp. C13]
MADPLNALKLDQLVEIIPEILVTLREDAMSIRGIRDIPLAAADKLFATICKLAEEVDLDLTGIPCWRNPAGKVIGMRTATRPVHAKWICEDIRSCVRDTRDEVFVTDSLRWAVRQSAGASKNVVSILVSELESAALTRDWDRFAEIRQGNRGAAVG